MPRCVDSEQDLLHLEGVKEKNDTIYLGVIRVVVNSELERIECLTDLEPRGLNELTVV